MSVSKKLIIDIARLDDGGERYAGELDATALDLVLGDDLVVPASNLAYDLMVEQIGEELLVRGRADMEINCVCSRCAKTFQQHVEDPAIFTAYSLSEDPEFMDLTDELREAMILIFPPYPVCGENCRGLCAQCGANLNNVVCKCKPEGADARWGALDGLKL
ncbi:MAG: DUF177 domain-containing protein [Lentisphaerae bacterium]|jgi:uncharacterized protein|nr:DUF177 domain-containing protein [Lentisphaerota bacterium]